MSASRPVPQQAQTPDLESALGAAAKYLALYEREVTAVIAQEDYVQRVLNEARVRRLRSDILIIAQEDAGWVELRDTFEVDERPVRDRDERIAKLFMKPNPDALQQARRIAGEGARFNISPSAFPLNRTLNVPLTALRFLRGPNQHRSTFQLDRVEPSRIVLKFTERTHPRLIATDDGAAAIGSFTIEPLSGRVLESEFQLVTRRVAAQVQCGVCGAAGAEALAAGINDRVVQVWRGQRVDGWTRDLLEIPDVSRGDVDGHRQVTRGIPHRRGGVVRKG